MNFIRTFTIFRYLTRQFAFHVFHIWLKLARAVGKIWNPLCFKQSLRGPSYPKPKSLGQSGDANFCVYMYGFACHNLRIPMTRRMSRLIKADPFRSSCHPPTGHPVDLVIQFTQAVHFQSRQSFGPMANNSLPRMDELRLLQPG